MVRARDQVAVGSFLCSVIGKLANWHGRASGRGIVDIHVFRFVGGTVGSLSLASFSHVLIECPLAVRNAVSSSCGLLGLLLLDLLVGLSLGDNVRQKFEVFNTSDCVG